MSTATAQPAGLDAVDDDQATRYHDVVMAELPGAARRHLEALMAMGHGRAVTATSIDEVFD